MRAWSVEALAGRVDALVQQVADSGWPLRIVVALAIALVGAWLAKRLSRVLDRAMGRLAVDQILRTFLRNLSYSIGLIVVAVAALDALGVPTTSLLAVLGAAGLAIGLALKDSLSNIASGVMLIVLRPFHAGDFVQIAGLEGTVDQVRVFQTVLRTVDNRTVILPNSLITTAPIVNFTARGQRRIDLAVGIGYEQDIRRARGIMLGVAAAHDRVLPEPAPEMLVSGFNDSSVGLQLRAWVATPDYMATRSDLLEAVHEAFREAGITIPYPQHDVRVLLPPGVELRQARDGG